MKRLEFALVALAVFCLAVEFILVGALYPRIDYLEHRLEQLEQLEHVR